ncbi:hypothetical protein LEP1GSC188_0133 [Leptospira weilii serovar Topaz str. LT2116]|uniref:Uncharacterized protein n=4 Tax=Leptospira weilii TaxID=28184 RepID=M3H0E4_9LEPT|nr:hypothetical protein LEP1GSC036_0604 [Leptospira weilii str. 2006001853]EMF82596.1 hypothetical protein LEP1GSC188_0133 [Leptospira weilii serovar Topaz str. LT2116]EMM74421.1 hypothetical protein LEP1GSC038_2458 [Leptospira weilii str. 2006001855]EMN42879.1 hypothetical protein LEP1GSC086_1767 [Leptospira weilii str. LNT 1234]EMY14350.1 hypothetical protein LEP1GSC043_4302 [Leptospira weilii str. Ecochallenge]
MFPGLWIRFDKVFLRIILLDRVKFTQGYDKFNVSRVVRNP